jgi:transposase
MFPFYRRQIFIASFFFWKSFIKPYGIYTHKFISFIHATKVASQFRQCALSDYSEIYYYLCSMEREVIIEKMRAIFPILNELQTRLYVASEVKFMGRGAKRLIEKELGISHNTINRGLSELESSHPKVKPFHGRERQEGGGKKKSITEDVWKHIEAFIMPHTRGEPASTLQWVSKSLRNIESTLKSTGISVSHRIIDDALKNHGFSLQSNRKRFEGKGHCDRDAQFEYIQKRVDKYISENQPVISVDAKKRELIGNFAGKGKE